jgi:signal transduction histidine kinase
MKESIEPREGLELLNAAGVAMAGSFDLRDILKETHRAGTRLLSGLPMDVLYLGCDAIHSKSRWFPEAPGDGNLSATDREALRARLEPPAGRGVIPLRYQDDLLGAIVFQAPSNPAADALQLLCLLAQHASTAIHNIHLTQERIRFERLSTIGRMIGALVHDFRGPLTALRGWAGMVASLDLDERERREYGRFMLEECDRLSHMVSELLEFTRGPGAPLVLEPLDLSVFLAELTARLRSQFKDHRVEFELPSREAPTALCDRLRLERALWNVAANACQAMPGGGRLKIRFLSRSEQAVIEVEDEGCGIPEEIRHRIFEPFFSFGKSEGIGLGLATTQKIIEEHGGRIEIESRARRGTVVRLLLPLAPRREPAAVGSRP